MDPYKTTIETFDKLADAYQEKFMDVNYKDTFDLFCRLLPQPGARIFEIACGPGNITNYLLSKRPDFKIEAIDLAPNMIRLAKANNPSATFSVMDAREIGTLPGTYDGIMCGFCMPYLSKAECLKLIGDCASMLNSGGIFYFSTMEGDEDKSGYETSSDGQHKAYIHYHRADELQEGLEKNSFELVELFRRDYPKPGQAPAIDMIFVARKFLK
jgi:2-polyprenyl-3-methyl-5-hydroxy-6-metoxy-1,4-benzoquinol methylase